MNKDLMNISGIETYLNGLIDNVVSNNTFVGALPEAIQSVWQDIIVIDCANAISDLNAYGSGTVLIWLYAKPLSSGKKNVAVLSKLEKGLNEVVLKAKSHNYIISRRNTYSDYDSSRKLHTNIVEIVITIL